MNAIACPELSNMHLVRLCAECSDAPITAAERRVRDFANKVMGADLDDLDEVCRREIARLIRNGVIRAEGFDF